MKAKEIVPASKPRNFVVKNQKTAGAGAHKDKKRAEKQGNVKHKRDLMPMEARGKWDPFSGGDFGQDPHPGQNDGAASPDKQKEKDKWEAMLDYYGTNALVARALGDLYQQTHGSGYYDNISGPIRYVATIVSGLGTQRTEVINVKNKQEAYEKARGKINGRVISIEKVDTKEDEDDLITLPVMLGLGAQRKKWMLKFPDERYAQKWEFQHKNVAKILWGSEHELSKPEEKVGEGMGGGVDAKGRTQQKWLKLVNAKFPTARIMQAKMIDGPITATLDDGRKLHWKKVEQGVGEAVTLDRSKNPSYPNDPATVKHRLATAKAILSNPNSDSDSRRAAAAIIAKSNEGVAEGEQHVAEGSAHGYNVVRWYRKNRNSSKITAWLKKEAGLPKETKLYFDDADLVLGSDTVVPEALVDDTLKFNDLLTALLQVTGGTPKQRVDGVYRDQGMAEGANDYEQRQKLIKYIAQKKGWDVSDLELAKTTELVLMYKKIKEQDTNESYIQELSSDLLASYKKKAGEQASAADKAGDYEKGNKRFTGILKATNKQFDNDAKKRK